MSAFFGGVARGILDSRRARQAAAAKQSDREFRAEQNRLQRETQLDVAKLNIKAQKDAANSRNESRMADAAQGVVFQGQQRDPYGFPVSNLPEQSRKAYENVYNPTIKEINGIKYYVAPGAFEAGQTAEQRKVDFKNGPKVLGLTLNPYLATPGAMDRAAILHGMSPEDRKNENKMANFRESLGKQFKKNEINTRRAAFFQENPEAGVPVVIPSSDKALADTLEKAADLSKFQDSGVVVLEGFNYLTNSEKSKIKNNPKNKIAFDRGVIALAQNHLSNIKTQLFRQGVKEPSQHVRYLAHARNIASRADVKSAFNNIASDAALNNNAYSFVDSRGVEKKISPAISPNEQFDLVREALKRNVANFKDIPTVDSQNLNTVDQQAKAVVDAGLASDTVKAKEAISDGSVVITSVPVSKPGTSVIDNGPTVATKTQPETIIERTVPEGVALSPDAALGFEGATLEQLKIPERIVKSADGSEKIFVGFAEPSLFDANKRKFNRFMNLYAMEQMAPGSAKRRGLEQEYKTLLPVFRAAGAFVGNKNKQNAQKLKDAISKSFSLADPTTNEVNSSALNFAFMKIAEKVVTDKRLGSESITSHVDSRGNRTFIKNSLPSGDPKNVLKLTNELDSEHKKIIDVDSTIVDYDESLNQFGFIEKFQKGEISDTELVQLFKNLRNAGFDVEAGALGDLSNAEKSILQSRQRRLAGATLGTDAAASFSKFFQKFKDIAKVFGDQAKLLLNVTPENGIGVMGTPTLKSFNLGSGRDASSNQLTRNRLEDVTNAARIEGTKYQRLIQTSLAAAQAAADNNDIAGQVRNQIEAYKNYLLAGQMMRKVSLTYTYAGLVQGESGGRAISNEDFAIIYQALWGGGVGGPRALGSLDTLKKVLQNVKQRNRLARQYVDLKDGLDIGMEMLDIHRVLRREDPFIAKLLEDSKTFNLTDAILRRSSTPPGADVMPFPKSSIVKISNGQKVDTFDRIGNPEMQMVLRRDFETFVGGAVSKALPDRIVRTRPDRRASPYLGRKERQMAVPFNRLKKGEQTAILKKGLQALKDSLYAGGSLRGNLLTELNRYSSENDIKLGYAIATFWDASQALKIDDQRKTSESLADKNKSIAEYKKVQPFLNSIIIEIYNNKKSIDSKVR